MNERAIELRPTHLYYVFETWDNGLDIVDNTFTLNLAIFHNPHCAFKFAAEYPIHYNAITIVIDY